MKKPQHRLRKHGEVRKAATKYIGRNRLGPLHIEARCSMLEQVLGIQEEVNRAARAQEMPEVVLINEEELARIEELMAANSGSESSSSRCTGLLQKP
jgi:DNA sulfur modification protein DndC